MEDRVGRSTSSRRRERSGPWWLVGSFLIAGLVVATGCRPLPGPPPGIHPKRVAFYGDSLLVSSAPRWRTLTVTGLPNWSTLERVLWGTAPCDHLEQMAVDASSNWNIKVVVIGFHGNQEMPCTIDCDLETLYREDLGTAVRIWQARGVRVVLVPMPGRVGEEAPSPAARATRSVAAESGAELVDLTDSFVDPDTGRYVGEIDGVAVRSPDGIHLCDHHEIGHTYCPSEAPGVVRLADPIAAAAVALGKTVK